MGREILPAILLLEDGTVFYGRSCGLVGTTTGEIAFNTAMTGYQEVFTDPSYYGQVVVMTAVHIGNYGVHEEDMESSQVHVSGVVIRKFSEIASRPGSTGTLQDFLVKHGKVGICELDTRALVRHIREKGVMNCIISSETTDLNDLREMLAKVPSMEGLELSSRVSCSEAFDMGPDDASRRIAVLDLGTKRMILQCLVEEGARLRVFPVHTAAEEILNWRPDGIMFSNGPGDPAAMYSAIEQVKRLIESGIPCMGICLGHQLIALSQGLKTGKMRNGHRGVNHPVKNLITGKCEITSQNHGFVVTRESVDNNPDIEVTHVHLNDQTIAGLRLRSKKVFSVQYHPEASAGPHDSRYLFGQFMHEIDEAVKSRVEVG